MKKLLLLFGVEEESFKNKKKINFTNQSTISYLQQKILEDFSNADVDEYDETVLS